MAAFLPEAEAIVPLRPFARVDSVAGWGLKPRSRGARRFAARRSLPYIALEDGFLRSLRPGLAGDAPLSLTVDPVGVYYDAARPSLIERLLASEGWETPDLLARARAGLRTLIARRLSKYNDAPMPEGALARRLRGGFVLVVDQTVGDASIAHGLADAASFARMLEAARSENPGQRILVKLHPDVASGRRRGYLEQARGRNVEILSDAVNPWALLEGARKVYVVTSQLGAEAALAGIPVRCFGLPFYAGWGLTEDTLALTRRTRRRTPEHLFAAAWLLACRYVDPFTGEATGFEETAETLALWRDTAAANRGPTVCLGISPWKRRRVRAFLGFGGGPVRFASNPARAIRCARRSGARLIVWASREPEGLEEDARRAGIPLLRLEDGFIRSAGLGAGLVPAASLVLDRRGIHYDPDRPSDLECLLAKADFPPALLSRARALREAIVAGGVSKYNLAGSRAVPPEWPTDRLRVLIPGQVEDDASVRHGARVVRTNAALLEAVRAARPEAFLIWKPHPDVAAGLRPGAVDPTVVRRYADADATGLSITDLLSAVDEVHTMTSLAGFEALLRGVRVVCWGAPFYAGWGLTEDRLPLPARGRRLSLDALVAAALILYPRYLDPVTLLPCPPERVVARFAHRAADAVAPRPWLARLNARLFARRGA
ncbi:MAG: beta-3-deoxy-D-manno-oct-2-ulosonic acid transferase [Acetobacteraceae bacterium]|nr:beta-3-deoxy-D-manno-oct-2-ulosonic acid transferase [Acetobacteraceae bacterium]